jgi:dGTPase
MINRLVVDLAENSQAQLEKAAPDSVDAVRGHHMELIGFSAELREQSLALKRFLRQNLYRHYRVHRMTAKADKILRDLFSGFMQNIQLLPPKHQSTARHNTEQSGDAGRARAVADYIAGMTDRFAIMEHKRIFDPSELT